VTGSETVLLVLLAALPVAGLVLGPWSLVLPFGLVPAWYLGLDQGWWGSGLGDGWQVAMLVVLAVAVVLTAAGLISRAVMSERRETSPR
jgi:hypothetical protein